MKEILLESGERLLAKAIAEGRKIKITQVRLGSSAGFVPVTTGNNVTPSVSFTGGSTYIVPSVINNDTVRYTVILPEHVGTFDVGNVMLFADDNGELVPFLWAVADTAVKKYARADGNLGTRLVFAMKLKFMNISENVDLIVQSPTYSSLASYDTNLVIPNPSSATYQQFFIQNHSKLQTPVFVARRAQDNGYFGFPFMQRTDDPNFGVLDGGVLGDGYAPYLGRIYWGNYYITPEVEYTERLEGGQYANPSAFDDVAQADTYNQA